jgi:hypothetical protein
MPPPLPLVDADNRLGSGGAAFNRPLIEAKLRELDALLEATR